MRNGKTTLAPIGFTRCSEFQIKHHLRTFGRTRCVIRNTPCSRVPRSNLWQRSLAACDRNSVNENLVIAAKPLQVSEVLPIGYTKCSTLRTCYTSRLNRNRRSERLVLVHCRLGRTVRPYNTIYAEGACVGLVTKIATVGPALSPVRELLSQAMVPELPDESSLESVVCLDGIPVLAESSIAIPHSVRVLTHDQGQVAIHTCGSVL